MKNKNVPEIRFPEFTDDWEQRKVGDFLSESKVKGSDGSIAKKLTVKLWRKGIIFKEEIYKGSSATQYYIRSSGQFMYGKLDFLNQAFGILPNELDGYESTLDSPAFDFKSGIDSNFFLEYVCLNRFYKYQGNLANGSRKAKRIHVDTFFDMPIIIPKLEEQQKIGSFFKQLDNTIALHQHKLNILKQTKQGSLQKMFPKEGESVPELRFPGFTDDWELRKLGVMAEHFEYGLNASAKKFDGINKYIRITDIDDVSHKFIQNKLTSPDTDFNSADNYLLKRGDILFARTGASVGKTFCYQLNDGKTYYAGFLIRARIKPDYIPEFIFQNTLTSRYDNFVKITSQRSGQPGINAQEYAGFEIMVPKRDEQTKIGTFFKQLDDTIALHQRELDLLKETKKGFLQKLFV